LVPSSFARVTDADKSEDLTYSPQPPLCEQPADDPQPIPSIPFLGASFDGDALRHRGDCPPIPDRPASFETVSLGLDNDSAPLQQEQVQEQMQEQDRSFAMALQQMAMMNLFSLISEDLEVSSEQQAIITAKQQAISAYATFDALEGMRRKNVAYHKLFHTAVIQQKAVNEASFAQYEVDVRAWILRLNIHYQNYWAAFTVKQHCMLIMNVVGTVSQYWLTRWAHDPNSLMYLLSHDFQTFADAFQLTPTQRTKIEKLSLKYGKLMTARSVEAWCSKTNKEVQALMLTLTSSTTNPKRTLAKIEQSISEMDRVAKNLLTETYKLLNNTQRTKWLKMESEYLLEQDFFSPNYFYKVVI